MKRYRNHEGYYDLTAGKAIQKATKKVTRKDRKQRKSRHLYFMLGELYCFKLACKMLKG